VSRYSGFVVQKLSDEQVRELRERYAAGERTKSLASAFGIAPSYVPMLVRGDARRSAGGPLKGEGVSR
jgi:hypothetical protein